MTLVIILIIYFGLNILTGLLTNYCLNHWPLTSQIAGHIRNYWMILHFLLSLAPVAGTFLHRGHLRYALQGIGDIFLGYFLYYSAVLAILMLIAGLARHFCHLSIPSLYGIIFCLSLTVSLAVGTYGFFHAQNIKLYHYDIDIDKPGKDMTVVFIADLHLSVNSQPFMTERMVELINQEKPDLVLVGGDIFTSSYDALFQPHLYTTLLSSIQSRLGVYAVYGNHDVEEPLFGGFSVTPVSEAFRGREIAQFVHDCGFTMLNDESVLIDGFLQLYGRIDEFKAGDGTKNRMTPEELLVNIDPDKPVLVLEHEPRDFSALEQSGADLVLCGHTHNGQIFPGNLLVPLFNENGWGYKLHNGLHTLVTSGVGTYGPPMRIATDSEISVIRLTFKQETGK